MARRLAECLLLLVAISWLVWLRQSFLGNGCRLDLEGSPGEFISRGKRWHLTPAEADFQARYAYSRPQQGLNFQVADFSLQFSAPGSRPLSVGHYESATRFPFQKASEAGLNVSGCGRGCNRLRGSFDILEIEYGPKGPTRFAADFVQFSEARESTPLRGSIRFHSRLP